VPPTSITGDIGGYPAYGDRDITGFALTVDESFTFSTSIYITGKVYAANYKTPTPPTVNLATVDMTAAYHDAVSRENTELSRTNLGAGIISGMTLTPGVYTWTTSLAWATDITLTGGPCAVFILQIAQDLRVGAATSVVLAGGVEAANVFWQVTGMAEIGEEANMKVQAHFPSFFSFDTSHSSTAFFIHSSYAFQLHNVFIYLNLFTHRIPYTLLTLSFLLVSFYASTLFSLLNYLTPVILFRVLFSETSRLRSLRSRHFTAAFSHRPSRLFRLPRSPKQHPPLAAVNA
jgi:hypothetical protein